MITVQRDEEDEAHGEEKRGGAENNENLKYGNQMAVM